MYPVIRIGSIELYAFHLCMICGILAGLLLFLHRAKELFSPAVQDTILALLGADVPFIFLGALLHNKIVNALSAPDFFAYFSEHLWENTGIAFLGGLVGGLIGFLVLYQVMLRGQISIKTVTDSLVPSILLGHAIGRIGCLFGGCCYGKPCVFGFAYPPGSPAYAVYGDVSLFPAPLVEAILLLILCLLCLHLSKMQTELYLIGYPAIRFFLEFFRGDDRGTGLAGFSPAQSICLCLITTTLMWSAAQHLRQSRLS